MTSSFTLDTNCIVALENDEPCAPAIRALVSAHEHGKANVAVAAISGSERQKDQRDLRNFAEFEERLNALSLGRLEILQPLHYWDVTFWDWCIFADEELLALERRIHEVLFPSVAFLWSDFCEENGLDPKSSLPGSKWRNHKCDVLALWSHIHAARSVFVTNDRNYHAAEKKTALIGLGAGHIEQVATALALI